MSKPEKHNILSLLLMLGIGLVAVVISLPRRSVSPARIDAVNGPVYTPGPSFETESLNDRMLVSQTFCLDSGRVVRGPAIRRSFTRNTNSESLLHGNSARVPVGWAYIALRNNTDQPMSLVLSMPQYRCNQATLGLGQPGPGKATGSAAYPPMATHFAQVGTLRNNTPLEDRFLPVF